MEQIIQNNSDFLFLYEAILSNPNGDPDQENKPRMDYDTRTNLVTDVRLKRYIREFLKQNGQEIFVDMEGDSKVGMDKRLENILVAIWDNDEAMKEIIGDEKLFNVYRNDVRQEDAEKTMKKLFNKKTENKEVNRAILTGLVKRRFADIRMFGSAFAVEGFNKALTGPIQLNWGYSLNEVYLVDSSTISSIMNEDSSTFGKDYRVKYSLLAFHGSVNKYAAQTTGLTETDLKTFREGLWNGISASPTRSKLNQYPKFFLELVYNEGYHNGHFGDLRNLIEARIQGEKKPQEVTQFTDLVLDFSHLEDILEGQAGTDKPLKEVIIRAAAGVTNPAQTWI
ncbi:MAG: type I-B CRISPR-associated protein Cas7/Csh2 [Lewinellaceae bacterium]|nr:type I-B CRISPR-associated protein Cas7/Csh2 [Phaeodactylibacter sp.]MCB9039788.1 type I-B CRISPR-associated protein Cas7/Csh2 [Lewinellaceae bacterium]